MNREPQRQVVELGKVLVPVLCRLVAATWIVGGAVSLVIAALLAFLSGRSDRWAGVAFLAVAGLVSIGVGLVVAKWFTRFMLWNLERCRRAWGLGPNE